VLHCALFCLAVAAALIAGPPPEPPPFYAIQNARVEVGDGTVLERATVVIEEGTITAVAADAATPAHAWVIAGEGLTVYPGLIDAMGKLPRPRRPPGGPGAGAAGPAGQKVSVEIETASIDTGHAERDIGRKGAAHPGDDPAGFDNVQRAVTVHLSTLLQAAIIKTLMSANHTVCIAVCQ